ncbi:hypothetical protein ACQP2E_01045 [Actinoplanes sp. CA-015351]|uniref:hypothetical protein n=1 Tax=Actinoplanes sp. CA-015351 TaxID=3239897 RepID=UPI003D95E437
MDAGLKRELEAKVYAGERLTREDGIALHESDDLVWLGRLAHHRRTELTGDRVTFTLNDHPNVLGESAAALPNVVDDVLRLRARQDETGGLHTFAPVRHESAMPAESLKAFAVARLLLDNVPHLTALWDSHGLSVAQLALNFGADDLASATPEDENAAPEKKDETGRDELLDLIWDAGFQPVERDDRFEIVKEHDKPISYAERRSEPQQVWA